MGLILLAMQEWGSDGSGMYPGLDDDGQLALADGEELIWSGENDIGMWHADPGARFETAWPGSFPAEVYLTSTRLVWVLRKFDRGSTYLGGPLAVALTAASKARAVMRRRGKAAVGQIRHEWPQKVIVRTGGGLLRRGGAVQVQCKYADGSAIRLIISLKHQEEAMPLATSIAQSVAQFRLQYPGDVVNDATRTALAQVASDPRFEGDECALPLRMSIGKELKESSS